MQTDKFEISIGNLGVTTTDRRGHTVEEVAEMATNKLVSVADTAPGPIKAQAHAFKNLCQNIITYYMQEAIKNHMCTIGNQLESQGHKDLAEIIRRL
jgi:phosphoribosyl-dephospho-CoA transferase|tara:strand:+ start:312 stop:602 length:291 start_codon:yes stop_codon:yes gene_type:complete